MLKHPSDGDHFAKGLPPVATPAPKLTIVLGQRTSWPDMLARAMETERLGFDGLYLVDHFFGRADVDEPTHEAWTMLGALAPFTQRLRLGVLVTGNTYRNPVFLLKQAVTVDHISNGRVDFGVGAGWHVREHEAYDFPLPPPKERVDRFVEAIEIWEALQVNNRTTYDGQHYHLLDAPFQPKPIQPRLPLLIGSSGPRMMRLTASHATIWNMIGTPEEGAAGNAKMTAVCEEVGRDPATLERAISPSLNLLVSPEAFAEGIAAYTAAGFQHICIPWPRTEAEVPVLREVGATIIPGLQGNAIAKSPAAEPTTLARQITAADGESIKALIASWNDAAAARLVGVLAAHPETRITSADLQTRLGLPAHADVTRATMAVAEGFAGLGLPRPWQEAQDGYLMSRDIAAVILG